MAQISSFKDLSVWQKSMDLVQEVYAVSKDLPKSEAFGLISQMQRSSVSIPSNIAEGSRRTTRTDFRQFCSVAMGSASELETQLLLVKRLYPSLKVGAAIEKNIEVQKMLNSLIKKLRTS